MLKTVFEVTDYALLNYKVSAWSTDLLALGYDYFPGIAELNKRKKKPRASTEDLDPQYVRGSHSTCLGQLVAIFIKPMIFVSVYSFYGIVAASAAALSVIMFGLVWTWFIGPKKKNNLGWASWLNFVTLLTGYLLIIIMRDPWLLQIVPTVFCVSLGLFTLADQFKEISWFESPDSRYHPTARMMTTVGAIIACIVGAAANEHIRTEYSLDFWVWYFAYFRLEVLLGLLVAILPGVILKVAKESNHAASEPS